jgi:hypothetical protein
MKPIRVVLFSGLRQMSSIPIDSNPRGKNRHAGSRGASIGRNPHAVRRANCEGLFIQPDDIIGGISFGGMLAGEIARQRRVAGKVIR